MGLPRSGITCRGGVVAAGRTGAVYTGRGPVCGTIKRRGGGPGVACGAGRAGALDSGAAGALGRVGGATGGAACTGAVSTSAGTSTSGIVGVSGSSRTAVCVSLATSTARAGSCVRACGGAGGRGGVMMGAGGRGIDCGVMNRGAGFASAGGAGVLAAGAAGFGGTADGGATTGRGGGGGVGRTGAAGCAARCVIAFSTSPGLEMCDRSILGLNSSAVAVEARDPRVAVGDCSAKNFFTRSASSSSIELECVFLSVTPILGRTSRISRLLTSSSRARSLIRTLCCITPRSLRVVPVRLRLHSILTVVVCVWVEPAFVTGVSAQNFDPSGPQPARVSPLPRLAFYSRPAASKFIPPPCG